VQDKEYRSLPNTSSDEALARGTSAQPVADGSHVSPADEPQRTVASVAIATIECLRPYQWLKNALVFVPLAAEHRLADIGLLGTATRAFIAFSLCASSIYVLNDLWDASADRLHPHKRHRPIASGRLPRLWAIGFVPVLMAGTVITVLPLGPSITGVLGLYFALMIAYTLRLKRIVLLDALILAGGYALRLVAGGLAVAIRPSPQLLAFCIFLFFSLALVKRYAELALLRCRDGSATHARAYLLEDQEFIVALGTSSGVLSVLVLALYMSSGELEHFYRSSQFIWLTCVLLLYWISHIWLTAHRGRMTDDPLVFAVKDRISLVLIILMGVTAWLAV
jgi:4-hydroxybenzoate polyprenyltransferase